MKQNPKVGRRGKEWVAVETRMQTMQSEIDFLQDRVDTLASLYVRLSFRRDLDEQMQLVGYSEK